MTNAVKSRLFVELALKRIERIDEMKKYKYRELKKRLKYIIWFIAQIAKFLRTMLAIMLLIVGLAYMTTQIHFSNIHVLEKELTEHITDFIICQITN